MLSAAELEKQRLKIGKVLRRKAKQSQKQAAAAATNRKVSKGKRRLPVLLD